MRGEELALHPVGLERMPADIEAEDLLLPRQPLRLGHGCHVRKDARRVGSRRVRVGWPAEQRSLTHRLLLLLQRRLLHGDVERMPVLRAVAAESIQRTRGDQRLEDAAVAAREIHALREIEEIAERFLTFRGEN